MKTGSNLFSKLYKYASAEGEIDRKENYFTEAFAILLEDKKFARAFIHEFLGINDGAPEVVTQSREVSGIIDIKLISTDTVIFIESKIGSPVEPKQLKNYLKVLDADYKERNRVLWLITKNDEHHKLESERLLDGRKNRFVYKRWSDIYKYLYRREKYTGDTTKSFILKNLIGYMEENGMDSFTGFNSGETGSLWPDFLRYKRNLNRLETEIKDQIKSRGYEMRDTSRKTHQERTYFNFYPSGYDQKAWIKNKIYLFVQIGCTDSDNSDYKQGTYISVGAGWTSSRFKNDITYKSLAYQKAEDHLRRKWRDDFQDWEFGIYRDKHLGELLSGTRNDPDAQLKKIMKFVDKSVEDMESSGLITTLKRWGRRKKNKN